jgi:membrane protein
LEINIGLHGAAIAFYAIFSTAPVIIILVWLLSIILGDQMGEAEFRQTIGAILGAELTKSVQEVVESTSQGASGVVSSIIAIITLLFGATTLLSQMKQTLNMIWGLKNPKIGTIWYFLWDRLTSLLFIGSLSLLFLVGLISESILYGLEDLIVPLLGGIDIFFIQIGSSLTNLVLAFTFFIVMFRMLPDLVVRWRDIAVGALATTIMVLIGKALIDWYLGAAALQPTYKAAGSFVIFLIWIYYNVQVVLIGVIFTQVFTTLYGGEVRPYWGATLDDDLYGY